jgi:hypothetical protein
VRASGLARGRERERERERNQCAEEKWSITEEY